METKPTETGENIQPLVIPVSRECFVELEHVINLNGVKGVLFGDEGSIALIQLGQVMFITEDE